MVWPPVIAGGLDTGSLSATAIPARMFPIRILHQHRRRPRSLFGGPHEQWALSGGDSAFRGIHGHSAQTRTGQLCDGWMVHDDAVEHGGHLSCFASHLYIDTKHQRGIALLVNVNRGQGCGHLYQLSPAMAKLLSGGTVSTPPIDHGNRASLLQLLGALVGIGIWLGWSLGRCWKWREEPVPVRKVGGCGFCWPFHRCSKACWWWH